MKKKVIVSAKELERIKADIEPSNSSIVDVMAKLREEMNEQRLDEKYVVAINENLVTISSLKNEFPTKIFGLKIKFDELPNDVSFILAPVKERSVVDEAEKESELVEHIYKEIDVIKEKLKYLKEKLECEIK